MYSKDCVIWTNDDRRKVLVTHKDLERRFLPREDGEQAWCDPAGAAYGSWRKMAEWERARLMVELALDLAMRGYALPAVIREFSKVDCFKALGRESIPMCLVLTQVLCGRRLEPNTMTFDELLMVYKPEVVDV